MVHHPPYRFGDKVEARQWRVSVFYDVRIARREPIAMPENVNVHLSEDEAQSYMYLGIIAANAGYRGRIYKARREVEEGKRVPNKDIGAWFAQSFSDAELMELYRFRNHLLHSVVFVRSDGTVEIFDEDEREGRQTYTTEQIKHYALRFLNIRLENRTTWTFSVWAQCKCGARFPQPLREEMLDHQTNCPVSNA